MFTKYSCQTMSQSFTYIESFDVCKCLEARAVVITLHGEKKETLEKLSHLTQINCCSRLALRCASRVSDSSRS